MSATTGRRLAGLGLAIVAALLTWYLQTHGDGATSASDPSTTSTDTSGTPTTGAVDPDSGLRWVSVRDLPAEGQRTLALIDAGGPSPNGRDGVTFENREGLLPDEQRGHYREYTVQTPGSDDRGARRIVAGGDGEFYYSDDHYQSFRRIAR
jgi:ribonuclease T1